jgi:excisionase family DNA binding protein
MEAQLTPKEAAKRLRVTPRTVRNWIASGRLSAVRVSDRVTRIPASEIERLLARPDLSSVLWDVDVSAVDEDANSRFLIRRILEAGRPEQVRWMLGRYSLALVLDVAENDAALPRRVGEAWAELLRRRRDRAA